MKHHEHSHGPHFNEELAHKAVKHMENEDGSNGPRWSIEEAERVASQYGVNLKGEKFNKYDWFVALNMIRSDFYRAVVNMTGSDNVKHFVELTKAWLNDKDIEEGKMWFYFKYVMCEEGREEDDEYEESHYNHARRGRMGEYHKRHYNDYYDDDDNEYEYEVRGTYNMYGGNYAMHDQYDRDYYNRGDYAKRRMSR